MVHFNRFIKKTEIRMRYIFISKKEKDYMNATGNIPDSIGNATDGCCSGIKTPEQKKEAIRLRDEKATREAKIAMERLSLEASYDAYLLSLAQSKK
jgi:hypothetical protein